MSVRDIVQAAAGVSTGNPNAWDISKAYYDPGADAGNVSKAIYNLLSGSTVAAGASVGFAIYIRPDGLKLYTVDNSADTVYQFSLSRPWYITSPTYDSKSFSYSAQEGDARDLFFKPDGTKMYILGDVGDDINEYDLSTAWDVSSASYVQNFSVSAQMTTPYGLFFKPDGTKMYVLDNDADDVNEYDLSTPWDISTASYLQVFSVLAQDNNASGLWFSNDGTKMYIVGDSGNDINEYTLSTAWDVSSASFVQLFAVGTQTTSPKNFVMDPNNGVFIVNSSSSVWQYTIGGFSVAAQETSILYSVVFKPDGTKMYVIGGTDQVHEYDLSTAWDITSASYLQDFSVAAKDTNPYGLWFKPDGTKMYICGTSSDSVHEYDLSVAWDVTSATFLRTKSIAAQDTTPLCIYFRDDGLKFYVTGNVGQDVNEYNLSSAWDISTMSFVQSFSVAAQTTAPRGIFFKDDGTKMYVVGASTENNVNEYDLATAWDVSTASYAQSFFTQTSTGVSSFGIFFKPDGTQFWIASGTISKVLSYLISEE